MKLSSITLTLMRQSAGVVIAAAAISGQAKAEQLGSDHAGALASAVPLKSANSSKMQNNDEPKKPEEEKPKKEKKEDPCPPCGMG